MLGSALKSAIKLVDLIRSCSLETFTTAARLEPQMGVSSRLVILVGIDLFARRCIEGGQLTKAAGPVT
jgi:hypothetical protein